MIAIALYVVSGAVFGFLISLTGVGGGSLVGTYYGAAFSRKIEPRHLQYAVVAVVIVAIAMIIIDKVL